MDDLDLRRQKYMPAVPPPASVAPTVVPVDDGLDARREKYQTTTGAKANVQPVKPQNGDPYFPELRAGIAQDPNADYGHVLPIKKDASGYHLAWPSGMHDFANGVLDLIEGPMSGTVTPDATNALLAGRLMRMKGGDLQFSGPPPPPGPRLLTLEDFNHRRELGMNRHGQSVMQEFYADGKTPAGPPTVGQPAKPWTGEILDPEEYYHPDFDPDAFPKEPNYVPPKGGYPRPEGMPEPQPATSTAKAIIDENVMPAGLGAGVGTALGYILGEGAGALPGAIAGPFVGMAINHMMRQYGPTVTKALLGSVQHLYGPHMLTNSMMTEPWNSLPGPSSMPTAPFRSDTGSEIGAFMPSVSPTPAPPVSSTISPSQNRILLPQFWQGA